MAEREKELLFDATSASVSVEGLKVPTMAEARALLNQFASAFNQHLYGEHDRWYVAGRFIRVRLAEPQRAADLEEVRLAMAAYLAPRNTRRPYVSRRQMVKRQRQEAKLWHVAQALEAEACEYCDDDGYVECPHCGRMTDE